MIAARLTAMLICMSWIDGAPADVLSAVASNGIERASAVFTPGADPWEIAERAEKKKDTPDMDMFMRIHLPANPTRAEVTDYINLIYVLSRNQRTELEGDPQVTMLAQVGRENMDVLLAASASGVPASKYGYNAIGLLAEEQDKQWVLTRLPAFAPLARVVLIKGWCQDAADTLAKTIARNGYVESEAIKCLVQKPARKYYPILKSYLAHGWNPQTTYSLIKDLPGIDVTDELQQAWEYSRSNNYQIAYLTRDVLATGYVPAFRFLFDVLDTNNGLPTTIFDAEGLVREFADTYGSRDELRSWYRTNKDALHFDKKLRKFVATADSGCHN
jgi:hypothetical protein